MSGALLLTKTFFGESHQTKFCQMLTWLPDEKQTILGFYKAGHNDAT
jgi:hypothetical protein